MTSQLDAGIYVNLPSNSEICHNLRNDVWADETGGRINRGRLGSTSQPNHPEPSDKLR